jgi:hypothetical protein
VSPFVEYSAVPARTSVRTHVIKRESETALFEKGGEISQESA